MNSYEARNIVVEAGKRLLAAGLTARTWGNVSCRIDENSFVITPSGREYDSLGPDDIVEVKISDLSYESGKTPSSEKTFHRGIYKLRSDVNFIIHTHQENASVLSAIGFETVRLDRNYEGLGDEVQCAKYALPGTKALCKNVLKAVEKAKGQGIILRNHGAVCFGWDCEEAFRAAGALEEASLNYIQKKRAKQGDDKAYEGSEEIFASDEMPFAVEEVINKIKRSVNGNKEKVIIWNKEPEVVRLSRLIRELRPYLDDFAQIVGVKMTEDIPKDSGAAFVYGYGAVCIANSEKDAEAICMIVRKNCKAFLGVTMFKKPKAISPIECALMRMIYITKYSKKAQI